MERNGPPLPAATQLRTLSGLKTVPDNDLDTADAFTRLYVVHYRGYHFYQDEFSLAERDAFLATNHARQSLKSNAAEALDDDDVEKLTGVLGELNLEAENGPMQSRANGGSTHSSPLRAVAQHYVGSIGGFLSFIQDPNDRNIPANLRPAYQQLHTVLGEAVVNQRRNPFISTSSSARHAAKYGSGSFIIQSEDETQRLWPDYEIRMVNDTAVLVPEHPCVGVVYVIVHPVSSIVPTRALSTHHLMRQEHGLKIDCRKAAENETIFWSVIPRDFVIAEVRLTCPDLSLGLYSATSECKTTFDMSKTVFTRRRDAILKAVRMPNDTDAEKDARKKARHEAEENLLAVMYDKVSGNQQPLFVDNIEQIANEYVANHGGMIVNYVNDVLEAYPLRADPRDLRPVPIADLGAPDQ